MVTNNSAVVLSSWKDIAAYLGKGVRTVQRWERELGLPVRRPVKHNRRIVIAVPAELDGWIRKQMPNTGSERRGGDEHYKRVQSQLTRLLEAVQRVQSSAASHNSNLRKAKENTARSVLLDLRVGLTLAKLALDAQAGSETRLRNRTNARKAYDYVMKFRNKASFAAAEEQMIDAGLAQLKSALEQLGESF